MSEYNFGQILNIGIFMLYTKIVLLFLLSLSSVLMAENQNMLTNGEFNSPSGWKLVDARQMKSEKDASNSVMKIFYSDKYIYTSKGGKRVSKVGKKRKTWSGISQKVHVKSETSYKLTFRARGISGGIVSLSKFSDAVKGKVHNLYYFDPDKRNGGKNLTNDWKSFTVNFRTPKSNKNKRLIIWKNVPSGGRNRKIGFEIDDLVLTKVN